MKQYHKKTPSLIFALLVLLLSLLLFSLTPAGLIAADKSVTDHMGRNIILPNNPQRLIALAPSITEIIFAIRQAYRLMAVTRFSDFPPEAAELPKVGSYRNPELERILALKPDLCIGIKDGNPEILIKNLESLKIPLYIVDPRNVAEVMETILEIGTILNVPKEAESVVNDMRTRINKIRTLASTTTYRPRVFFQIGISPIVSAGTDTFIHELITLAGGNNLAQGDIPYPRFHREQILGLLPEVFIITSMARGGIFEQVRSEWCRWKEIPAVKHNRIFLVDSDLLDRPAPRLAEGLEVLFRLIHPELAE